MIFWCGKIKANHLEGEGMEQIFNVLESIFSTTVFGEVQLYDLIATLFKYIFVLIVYYFIFLIIKMVFLDIRDTQRMNYIANTYLKLINRKEQVPFNVQEHYFIGGTTTIGRDESNTITIKDRYMSKHHAQILKEDGLFFLEDLGSANGTFLNGKEITDAIELKDKDIIDIGQLEFLFVNSGVGNEK